MVSGLDEHAVDVSTNRLLLGSEALGLQGFPTTWVNDAAEDIRPSDPQQMDLAGNAFTSTIIMAIFMGIALELCLVRSQSSGSATDLDAIMALMAA